MGVRVAIIVVLSLEKVVRILDLEDRLPDLLSTLDFGQLLNEASLDELNETLPIEVLFEISLYVDEALLNRAPLLTEALSTETSLDGALLTETRTLLLIALTQRLTSFDGRPD